MAFWLQEKLACLPAELHTVAGRQEDIQYIPAKFLKKAAVNVHSFYCFAFSSLKGIIDFFSALSCLWLFLSCYFQKEKKIKTGKLPHTNIFFLNLTFSWFFFFFSFLLMTVMVMSRRLYCPWILKTKLANLQGCLWKGDVKPCQKQ